MSRAFLGPGDAEQGSGTPLQLGQRGQHSGQTAGHSHGQQVVAPEAQPRQSAQKASWPALPPRPLDGAWRGWVSRDVQSR